MEINTALRAKLKGVEKIKRTTFGEKKKKKRKTDLGGPTKVS